MNDCYDIIIIGAGPAGLNAGLHAMRSPRTISILIIDKVVPWEHPIQCAEAVGRLGFREAIDVKESWIRQAVTTACFHAPDNTTVTYTDKNGGCIIDRAAMQRDCARELTNKGVTFIFNRRVVRISRHADDSPRAVEFEDGATLYGRVVIDASGPLACLGKDERLAWKPMDLEPAYFVHAEGNDLPADRVHVYINHDLAPGGYAWAFPRGKNAANIGILIGSRCRGGVNIRRLLDVFLERYYPAITIVNRLVSLGAPWRRRGFSRPATRRVRSTRSPARESARPSFPEDWLATTPCLCLRRKKKKRCGALPLHMRRRGIKNGETGTKNLRVRRVRLPGCLTPITSGPRMPLRRSRRNRLPCRKSSGPPLAVFHGLSGPFVI
jgi:hypothetical protein